LTIAGSVLASGTPLQTYPDVNSWLAAVTALGDATFEGQAPVNGSTSYNNSAGYTEAGVKFVGYSGGYDLMIVNPGSVNWWYNFGSGASLSTVGSTLYPVSIVATLPANMTAVALNVMVAGNAGLPVVVTASDGSSATIPTTAGQASFFGAIYATPITSLTVASNGTPPSGTYVLLDNFRYGTADSDGLPGNAPEIATMLLIGTGLLAMAAFRKRMI
jgi:hypothetical protein